MDSLMCIAWLPLAIIASAVISGVASYLGNKENSEEAGKAKEEDLALAREQFEWGKRIDLFDMNMETQKAKLDTMNNALKNNVALQDRFRTMFAPLNGSKMSSIN